MSMRLGVAGRAVSFLHMVAKKVVPAVAEAVESGYDFSGMYHLAGGYIDYT